MGKLFAIVQREFIERVRTKAFLIGTLIGPLLFFAIGMLPGLMLGKPTAGQTIAVIDATTGQVAPRLLDSLGRQTLGAGASEASATSATWSGHSASPSPGNGCGRWGSRMRWRSRPPPGST